MRPKTLRWWKMEILACYSWLFRRKRIETLVNLVLKSGEFIFYRYYNNQNTNFFELGFEIN